MMDENVGEKEAASSTVILENAEAARMHARADLQGHLRSLINRADSSDLQFLCKDAVKVHACRTFLTRRSPVLDSMLTNGMLESKSSIIHLPEIPAAALLAILELLYTGDIDEYRPSDWTTGLEIISAANFLLLPTVDKIVEEFNMTQIRNVAMSEDLQNAATMLSAALAFKCFSHEDNAAFLKLVSLVESKWMWPACACHLSEEAIDFVLKHTKPNLETKTISDVCLEEYFRFRGVLLWCMFNSSSSSKEVEKLVDAAIPISSDKLYRKGVKDLSSMEVEWLPEYDGNDAQDEIIQILRSHGIFDSAIRLLAHVDWVRMPPALFLKIVEPMNFVSESTLLSIFRFHYTHRMISMPLKVSWAHNESYAVQHDGLVIQKHGISPGSAICQLKKLAGESSCTWRCIIQKANTSCCQLGFVCSEKLEKLCRAWNFERDCMEALEISGLTVLRMIEWAPRAGAVHFSGHGCDFKPRGPHYVKSVETVEFQYHQSTRECAIIVDDEDLGTVWTGLPVTSVFPIVSLGGNSGAWVELDVVSGFEIF